MRAPTSYLKLDQEQRRPIVSSFDVTAFYSLLYHSQLSLIFDILMQCVPVGCWIIPSSALHNKNSPTKCPPKVTY